MHTQLAVFCVLAVSVVLGNGDGSLCPSRSCRQRAGVYYIAEQLTENITANQIVTLHADGTVNVIDSTADGTAFPPSFGFAAFSNNNGVWTCAESDRVKVNGFVFLYPTSQFPRSIGRSEYILNFDRYGAVSGTSYFTVYDLESTKKPIQSQWKTVLGPLQSISVTGYKLFNTCSR